MSLPEKLPYLRLFGILPAASVLIRDNFLVTT